jgi:mannose-6-phosphate isomerase-like protein (cupin superfamily)
VSAPYTFTKLDDVEDSAPKFGHGEIQEARFAKDALEAETTAVSFHRLKPGKRQAFGHKHDQAEEIYVVLAGSGRVKLGDEIVALEPRDVLRVAPGVMRAFEADDAGLEWLAFGQRRDGDAEIVPGWWGDNGAQA